MSSSARSTRPGLAGIALAWFLLFPSLGIVQKYFGTRGAATYLSVGSLLLVCGALNGVNLRRHLMRIDQRLVPWATAGLLAALGLAFVVLYSAVQFRRRLLAFAVRHRRWRQRSR